MPNGDCWAGLAVADVPLPQPTGPAQKRGGAAPIAAYAACPARLQTNGRGRRINKKARRLCKSLLNNAPIFMCRIKTCIYKEFLQQVSWALAHILHAYYHVLMHMLLHGRHALPACASAFGSSTVPASSTHKSVCAIETPQGAAPARQYDGAQHAWRSKRHLSHELVRG